MYFKAAIFDLDGTVLDTLKDIQSAVNDTMRKNGFPTRNLEEVRLAVGTGMRELTRKSLPAAQQKNDELIDACFVQTREYYLAHWNAETRPYDGICELLSFLKENGISASILSNKPDAATQRMVPYFFGDTAFTYIYGERADVPRKPDPTLALALARDLGVLPENILFVGDSSYDMLTAKNAGMFAAGVLWGFRDEQDLREAGADFIAHTPQDLIELIKTYHCSK